MTFDLELLRRSVSTVKHADTRSMFQLILNNFIMVSRRLSTSADVSSSVYSQIVCKVCPQIFSETTLDAEFIFSTCLQFGLYLVPTRKN